MFKFGIRRVLWQEGEGDGGGGGGNDPTAWDNFIATVPEAHREAPSILKFKDNEDPAGAIASSYIAAEQLVGRDKIPMPKTDDEYRATFKRLGMPDEATGYELAHGLEDLNEKEKFEFENSTNFFREISHKLGLTKTQAEGFFKEYAAKTRELIRGVEITAKEKLDAAKEDLRAQYGAGYETKMTLANRAIEHLGGAEVIEMFKLTGLGAHPAVVKMMVKVGEAFAEDMGIDKSTGDTLEHGKTIQGKVDELIANPAYVDKKNPLHKSVVAQVTRLMQQMHGTQEIGTARANIFNA